VTEVQWLTAHRDLFAGSRQVADTGEGTSAIYDLLVANAVYYDAGDIDSLTATYEEDAVYTTFLGTYRGAEEIRAIYASLVDKYERSVHTLTNVTIAITSPTTAQAASYVNAVILPRDEPSYAFVGNYNDALVRRSGRWRIARRTVHDGVAYLVNSITPSDRLRHDGK
jgi:3-phenylpropionate/cinnamic acid dioxygenase small subunit